ncbi:uroporphyrinogen-III C-methyltransferase [Halorhodospira abdelmalekii]|uniref:siroheme synthase CysG n=1 Tax=Halorhodospira abdelmalekii TaxID=421629 RepID=UPI001906D8D1|nr:siroheme synthase CysG [Halorhodospira abdelmalekii]MBK1735495.1 uroporphyrinogen-III C-methyltransferase [Halorhodospira abdelmalekii]
MQHYPIFLKLHGRRCLVIGGDRSAAQKAEDLLRAGAFVTLVAPQLNAACQDLLERYPGWAHHRAERYRPGHEQGAALVLSTSDDAAINQAVHEACCRRGIPVNVVDQPALCSYISPALIDRSPLQVAITSGGAAPVLARQVRAQIETLLPTAYSRLASLAGRLRQQVRSALPDPKHRLRFWEQVFSGPAAEAVLAGREQEGEAEIVRLLEQARSAPNPRGEVFLVGAGPGNPDLLTFRALRLMQLADVVLYDHLGATELLHLVRKDAERIAVGKRCGKHTLPQEQINAKLIELAQAGKRVLRLKGGDPLIFGRGGEEIEGLIERGIPFQIVPGVSAAQGAASFAGIPLTHRDYAQSCRFLTGHRHDGRVQLDAWAPFHATETLVIYMGLKNLGTVCDQLRGLGLPANHPAAVVSRATTAEQRVVVSTLRELPGEVASTELESPALIIVGPTVVLQERLAWFDGDESAAAPPSPSPSVVESNGVTRLGKKEPAL